MDSLWIQSLKTRLVPLIASISVEPVFFLDGFAFSVMTVLVESLQFDKICKVNLNYTEEICKNFDEYPEEKELYSDGVSSYKRNEGIITSIIPLFFILFIGAWSDKYGRKVPLCLTLFCHILHSGGYLLNAWLEFFPVEVLLVVGFLDSIGGGPVAFLTVANAYISDVTTHEQRTSRVALANSLWFLGGPMGTLIGTEIFKAAGYTAVFATSLVLYIVALVYVSTLLPESHGPFRDAERLKKITKPKPTIRLRDTILRVYGLSQKNKKLSENEEKKKKITYQKMFVDFFDIKRVICSFKIVFRKRDGFTRLFIFMLILSNFVRKIGRGAYAFYFAKEVLKWSQTSYGYWTTYKNFITTIGSLLAVPILSTKLKVSDNALAMIGALSSVVDYILYGFVNSSTYFFMWIGPFAALLLNSCSIATRAMMSKYVNADELGQVSAVTGTLEGVVPIVSTTLYSAITKATFQTFPGTQYFFGAACGILMTFIFVFIMVMDKGDDYDLQKAKHTVDKGPVREKIFLHQKDSNWLFDTQKRGKIRLSTILLSNLNFSIEVPSIERVFSCKERDAYPIPESDSGEDGGQIEIGDEKSPRSQKHSEKGQGIEGVAVLTITNETLMAEKLESPLKDINNLSDETMTGGDRSGSGSGSSNGSGSGSINDSDSETNSENSKLTNTETATECNEEVLHISDTGSNEVKICYTNEGFQL